MGGTESTVILTDSLTRKCIMTNRLPIRMALFLGLAIGLHAASPAPAQGDQMALPAGMEPYLSPYYVISTDLGADDEREAAVRMTKMAEEYHARTSGFSGVIRTRLPFYIFKRSQDYYAAGGPPGSSGVFMSSGTANTPDDKSRLMAIAWEGAQKDMQSSRGDAGT